MSTQRAIYQPFQTKAVQRRFNRWRLVGLGARGAAVLAMAGADTVDDVQRLGRAYFEDLQNVGLKTRAEIERLVGGWTPEVSTPLDAVAVALSLAIPDADEARAVARDVLLSMTRCGFMVTTSQLAGCAGNRPGGR